MLFLSFYLSAIRQRQSSVCVMPIRHALYMSRKQGNASLVSTHSTLGAENSRKLNENKFYSLGI